MNTMSKFLSCGEDRRVVSWELDEANAEIF